MDVFTSEDDQAVSVNGVMVYNHFLTKLHVSKLSQGGGYLERQNCSSFVLIKWISLQAQQADEKKLTAVHVTLH